MYGWRPSSPSRAAMSTFRFGCSSSRPATRRQVLGRAADVGADERRPRVRPDEPPERRQQGVEPRHARGVGVVVGSDRPGVPVRVGEQLLPALVRRVERLEEGDRVGDVDDDREPAARRRSAHSGSSRGSSTATSRPSGSRARRPSVFQTLSPRAPRATESRSRAASVSPNDGSVAQASHVEARDDDDPVRRGRRPAVDLGRERLALAAVEVDDRLDARTRRASRSARPRTAPPSRRRRRRRGGCGRRPPGTSAARRGGPAPGATSAAGTR